MSRIAAALLCLCISFPAQASLNSEVQSWLSLRDAKKTYSFQTYASFLNSHPDWPETTTITMYAEQALMKDGSNAQLVNWFGKNKPVTDAGRIRYVMALAATGRSGDAATLLRTTWQEGAYNEKMQPDILARFGGWLSQSDHEKRMHSLLWKNNLDRAAKAATYVSNPSQKQIARARIALQRGSSNALAIVSSLPPAAANDNGVLLDLTRYYRQRDMDGKASQTLGKRRQEIGPHAAPWWRERSLLVRRYLERGNYNLAYALAKAHGFSQGAELAEAEWLAGWLAVTRLKQPSAALTHFDRMYRNVKTPISIARAAYWAGIAANQTGNKTVAQQWYRVAAVHMNTFYGQLGAYALGNPKEYFAAFFAKSKNPISISTSPLRQDIIGAARIMHNARREKERDAFLRAALRVASEKGVAASVIPVARELDSQPIALMAAKAAYEKGTLVSDALFPRPKVPPNKYVETALTLGITRQESLFDRFAQSPAGARGLMQLMPATARQTAKQAGIPHNSDSQLFQPAHNMMLGQAYLTKMLARYDGFVPLAAAAYNGGPGNVDKWLKIMGDPRKDPYTWVDWVERIPFYETRNYVQRVWEAYAAYQYLFSAR